MTSSISDYALLGDCGGSALVSRSGAIDWLCLPKPDSPSIFAAILDPQRGGRWTISPAGVRSVERRYIDGSFALQTLFRCEQGDLILTDNMVVHTHEADLREVRPDREIARRLECVRGRVSVRMTIDPRPEYGARRARVRNCAAAGLEIQAGHQSLLVRTDIPRCADGGLDFREDLTAGDVRWAAASNTSGGPAAAPMLGEHAETRLRETVEWWRQWGESCSLPRTSPEATLRSALTLKAMVYSSTGAVLAAPTTSLPEELGGERNWDYRYCWIRDASFTMRAMLNLGVHEEAWRFFSWLMYSTRLTWPRLRVLYDVHGRRTPRERTLDRFAGYKGSTPVRVGNGARGQIQLDTYGALLDAAWQFHRSEGRIDPATGRMLRGFARTALRRWREPDAGIWEIRSPPRRHTLSAAMCWVAADRAIRLAKDGVMRIDIDRWERKAEEIRHAVRSEGYNHSTGSYAATLAGEHVDASLLLLSVYGVEPADSDRMNRTIDLVYDRLADGAALHRYVEVDDGVRGEEGRFGICGFWGVEALARAGRDREAHAAFDALMDHQNDVGLFAEEVGDGGEALGNFPQALTHVGVVNAARALDDGSQGAGEPSQGRST